MSTTNISWGVKAVGALGWQPYHLHVPIVLKSGSLNLLEPSGPIQACNGTALYSFDTFNIWCLYSIIDHVLCVLYIYFFFALALWPNAGHGLLILEVSRSHTMTHHIGRTPLDEWSARCRDFYLTTHNTHNRQTSMPPVGFEPMISAGKQPQNLRLRPRGHWDRQYFS